MIVAYRKFSLRPRGRKAWPLGGVTGSGILGSLRRSRHCLDEGVDGYAFDRMIPEVVQAFRAAMQRGEFITDAAAEAGPTGRRAPVGWSPRVVPGRAAAGTCRAAACPSLSAKSARSAGPAGVDPQITSPSPTRSAPSSSDTPMARSSSSPDDKPPLRWAPVADRRVTLPRDGEHEVQQRQLGGRVAGPRAGRLSAQGLVLPLALRSAPPRAAAAR